MQSQKIYRFLHFGFDSDAFSDFRDEINSVNLVSLRNISLIATILPLIMLFCSFLPGSPLVSMRPGYIIICIAMGISLLLSCTVLVSHPQYSRIVWCVLLFGLYLGGIIISTVLQSDSSAVTMMVFVVCAPLFFLEKPVVVCGISGIMSILFAIITNIYKAPKLATTDTVNICVFYTCGVIVYYQTSKIKLRDMASRAQIRLQRDTDSLTGLHNRLFCENIVNDYASRFSDGALFLMLDLDNFKAINDQLGHDTGDAALKTIAHILLRTFRSNDIIGRMGGDEFIVFLPSCLLSDVVIRKIKSLISAVSELNFDGGDVKIGVSIGISRFPEDGKSFKTLYKCADLALYSAKDSGKGRFTVFNTDAHAVLYSKHRTTDSV